MAERTEQEPIPISDAEWQAIIDNDASQDGRFFYAVKTTGIFCRPSCKSKAPNKDNVRLFRTADQALRERFRPCKRCKPTGSRLPDDEWITLIAGYIDNHYAEQLTLGTLADIGHGSPFHLQRTFKRVKGMTPMDYVQRIRIEKAKEMLSASSMAVSVIGPQVGLANTPYFITLFKKKTGHTPASYRQLRAHAAPNKEGGTSS